MPVRLRLSRIGRKHQPHYRLVAADSRFPRNGRHLEVLGSWHPLPDMQGYKRLRLKNDRVKYWLSVGAEPTDSAAKLLGLANILPVPPVKSKLPLWRLYPNAANTVKLNERFDKTHNLDLLPRHQPKDRLQAVPKQEAAEEWELRGERDDNAVEPFDEDAFDEEEEWEYLMNVPLEEEVTDEKTPKQ